MSELYVCCYRVNPSNFSGYFPSDVEQEGKFTLRLVFSSLTKIFK